MGKIRVKTLGNEEEKKEKQEAKKRAEAKKVEAARQRSGEDPGDESRWAPEGVQEAEAKIEEKLAVEAGSGSAGKKTKKSYKDKHPKRTRSTKYKEAASRIDRKKAYSLTEALEVLPKLGVAKFDETVELHINTVGTGVSGSMTLPHGSGKTMRVAIATDELIAEVEKGGIDFDILLAEPSQMPKLARIAKFLGPKGLMPNPKNGTITPSPTDAAKKYQAGFLNFKTEAKAPLLHLIVGKVSFGDKKLAENIKTAIQAVQTKNITSATLKSTMSPGLKIDAASLS